MLNLQSGLVIILLLGSVVISIALISFVGKRMGRPGAKPFTMILIGTAIWSLTYGFELIAGSLDAKSFWVPFQYIGIVLIPPGWLLFTKSYAGGEQNDNWKRVFPIMIIPLITVFLAFTNPFHGLMWAAYKLNSAGSFTTFQTIRYGLWWWVFFLFAYGSLIWGTVIFLRAARIKGRAFRNQFVLILIGLVLPWLANLGYLAKIGPLQLLDFSPVVFSISALILAIGIYRFHLFDLVPLIGQSAIRRLDSAAFIVDSKDRIIELNESALLMLASQPREPVGEIIGVLLPWWDDLDLNIRQSNEITQNVSIVQNGLRRYLNIQITPVWGKPANVLARVIIIRDITGEKLAGEAMALAQVKTEFLAKVGHELRSPLTGILGVAEMLDYGVYGPLTESQRTAVKMISNSTHQMTRLVNDLLQQSRLERGTFKLDLTEFTLTDLIQRVDDHVAPMARIKGLRLILDVDDSVPKKVCSDSLRLYQILINLLDNAVKYTMEGEVRLHVFSSDQYRLTFQVCDTGVGIPKNLQRLIFNPFQQANDSVTQKESGFGLGLSIVKQLVTLMDGEIKMESKVGVGSVFSVILPIDPIQDAK